ncbi:hypothetical protein YC2023_044012 [Brassica napus]
MDETTSEWCRSSSFSFTRLFDGINRSQKAKDNGGDRLDSGCKNLVISVAGAKLRTGRPREPWNDCHQARPNIKCSLKQKQNLRPHAIEPVTI